MCLFDFIFSNVSKGLFFANSGKIYPVHASIERGSIDRMDTYTYSSVSIPRPSDVSRCLIVSHKLFASLFISL